MDGSPLAAPARILLVEDNDDTRQLLAMALGVEGYAVDQASTAAEGLESLRRNRYDLVLTDYDLPGKTGSTMLKEAAREGLLRDAATVVVTAHPQPERVGGADVIPKPLELPRFLRQVRHILNSMAGQPTEGTPTPVATAAAAAPPQVELVLYVTADSPASQRARRHLESALGPFDPAQVRLEVCDGGEDPARGEADRVVFTPTLVARSGGLSTWVLGDLADRTMLWTRRHRQDDPGPSGPGPPCAQGRPRAAAGGGGSSRRPDRQRRLARPRSLGPHPRGQAAGVRRDPADGWAGDSERRL